ncbi:MAG: hypothetical protein ACOYMB_01955 [Patescibacteria group bacterium]
MSNLDDIKEKAKKVLNDASTEKEAEEKLTGIGLTTPFVTFSKPNKAGYVMKMGMAYYKDEIINF